MINDLDKEIKIYVHPEDKAIYLEIFLNYEDKPMVIKRRFNMEDALSFSDYFSENIQTLKNILWDDAMGTKFI